MGIGRRGVVLVLAVALGRMVWAGGIEGAAERYRFEPGDRVLHEDRLEACPVGELLPGWKVGRGGYECARFEDRMWIRPLEHGTVLYLPLEAPLPAEFSLEMTVHSFEPGRPMLRLGLHTEEVLEAVRRGAPSEDWMLVGAIVAVGDPYAFGAKEEARGSLGGRWAFRRPYPPGRDHRVAIQVRRGQVRFFVDGRRVGHLPFRPERPPRVLTLYFRRVVGTQVPFADAPVLVRGIRIAGYTRPEPEPRAESDLIRELGAEETAEGLRVTLAESVLFDSGSWRLRPEAGATLEKVARLARATGGPVRVEGHTDDVGPERFNLVLSELRAHVVALALARLGVDPRRLEARGFGESRPVAPNDSEAGRARNRRVEVYIGRDRRDPPDG